MKASKCLFGTILTILVLSSLMLTGCQTAGTSTEPATTNSSATADATAGTTSTASNQTDTSSTASDSSTNVTGLDGEPVDSTSSDSSTAGTDVSAAEARLNQWGGGRLSPADFVAMLGPIARATMQKMGVPASVILAQAALETGWGASSIGNAKNLFGIKGTGPAGSTTVSTQEYGQNGYYSTKAGFRKYNTWQESVEDHSRLLSQSSRYSKAMAVKNDPKQFAREIHKAGYATDPRYAEKLIQIMDANDLYKWNN
jgi:flagellum-specific peptidoglycan hydrolase FlgJ